MDDYTRAAMQLSARFTHLYSTSFSSASKLFDASIRPHIYAIYGLVRVADEIVDTYKGNDQAALLVDLETETYAALQRGYSSNPLVHAFAVTTRQYGIDEELIGPFFASMRMDLEPRTYDQQAYDLYIYGSAEVIGLMCLKVFVDNNSAQYEQLMSGARRLGAAYQKVNFLRDIAADHNELGRFYFPGLTFESLDDTTKQAIVTDIQDDFTAAKPYVRQLPASARKAVLLSYRYYDALLATLAATPVATIKQQRISVPRTKKLQLLLATRAGKAA